VEFDLKLPTPRLAIVNSHPIQYFAPLYAHIAAAGGIDLKVFYLSDSSLRGGRDSGFSQVVTWDVDLLSGYEYEFLGEWRRSTPRGFGSLIAPELFDTIRKGKFDAVLLHGYAYAADWVAFAGAKAGGAAILMRGESHLGLTRQGVKARIRRSVLSLLFQRCDGLLAIGSANRDFYRAFGVPDSKISLVPYAVDNARFSKGASLAPHERRAYRQQLGVQSDDIPLVLFVSKFQQRKRPDAVIRAAARLRREKVPLQLVMAGAGAMEASLRSLAAEEGIADTVFPGFVNQSEMPRLLGASDVFVLPSEEEPWGLVVNEAMCAGLPIIVGDRLGCVFDLVIEGENGFAVPAGDDAAIADRLRPILTDSHLRASMGRRSVELIANWSYRECREGLLDALNRARAQRRGIRE
jgi:glycosyltransferase involved in cell wall biosynthesis